MKQITIKQLGTILLIVLGLILAFASVDESSVKHVSALQIAHEINERVDHISSEQLGHLIIDKDPDLLLIDLRSEEEYQKFHIPMAVNYPLEQFFQPNAIQSLDTEKLLVLYTNGGTHAAQAWVLLRQMGITNATVLLGGLNYWVNVYSNPDPPEGVYADSEIFRYQFLLSAGNHLLGTKGEVKAASPAPDSIKFKPVKRKKKTKSADEGC
jgi:rhodanese-related sulfurtransferase